MSVMVWGEGADRRFKFKKEGLKLSPCQPSIGPQPVSLVEQAELPVPVGV
jgi:hypothetical protein